MASKNNTKSRIRIKLKSYDVATIDQSASRIVDVAVRTGAMVSGPVPLPIIKELFSYPRSTSNDKRSFEQFERRTHVRIIDILNPTPTTISELSNLKLPTGVGIVLKS